MTLPASGQITLDQIHVEAGGTTGSEAGMNDADIRALIEKTSGAQNAFNEYYGVSKFTVELSGIGDVLAFAFTTSGTPVTVTAGVRFDTNGQAQKNENSGYVDVTDNWGSPLTTDIGSDYTIRLTVNTGSAPSSGPAVDTDHVISTLRTWEQSVTGENAVREGNWTLTLKKSGVTVATHTFDCSASVSTI